MRITTNMVMRNYQSNLTSALGDMERKRKQVETGRRFEKSYEDPSAAAKGYILERRYSRNGDYINSVEDVQKWQDTQESVVSQINEMAKEIDRNYSPGAMSDPNAGTGRSAYAQAMREMQKSMVYALNTKYGDAYAMAGSDGMSPPFELSEDGKTLTYRGLDVNDPANAAALEELSREKSYVDIGFGLTFDAAGQVVSSSAFDSAFPGINAVGYGRTDDGTSKNLILLAGQMAEKLESDTFDRDGYAKLWDQFKEGTEELQNQFTRLGAKTQLLGSTKSRLESEKLAIDEQYENAVGIKEAEAIMNYSWAQYAYNTALKVGTSIISPSLLDFMK